MSQSWETEIYLSDDSGFSTNPIALGVRDLDLIGNRTFTNTTGKRGDRMEYECRTRVTSDAVGGGFNLYFTDSEFDWIIERALGDNISGYPAGATAVGTTIPAFYLFANKGGLQTYRYDNMRINRLAVSGAETQLISARADLVGESENEVSDVTQGANYVDCDSAFAFQDITLTIGGTGYPLKSFNLIMDNQIVPQYENSVTQSIFEAGVLMVRLSVTAAYRSATQALYRRAVAGDDNCTLAIADGTNTYTFTFANLKIPGNGPTVPEQGELTMPLEMIVQATDDGAGTVTDSIVVAKT